MRLRYTGLKPSKTVEWKGVSYVFDPVGEVADQPLVDHLCQPSMQGLFVVEPEPVQAPEPVPETQVVAADEPPATHRQKKRITRKTR